MNHYLLKALQMRRDLQQRYEDRPQVEVVLFGAEKFEDLRVTHARFFKSVEEVSADASTETPDTALDRR